jgi:hypothetical protein
MRMKMVILNFHNCYFFWGYNGPINASHSRTQARKGLISYFKTNGITNLQKYVDVNHAIESKRFEEEMNKLMKGNQ